MSRVVGKGEGSLQDIGLAFWAGLKDALSFHLSLLFLFTSPTVRNRALKCVVLNGFLFLGSLFAWRWLINPAIRVLLSVEDERLSGLSGPVNDVMFLLFQVLWLWPIYGISFILNTMWYQDIADNAFAIKGGKRKPVPFSLPFLVESIAQELYRLLLVGTYLLQIFVVSFVPFGIGMLLCCLLMAWLYSFYSFEYAWGLRGVTLQDRLGMIESHWPYFLGFGLPAALTTMYSPRFIDLGIFALIFPVFIILGINSTPRSHLQPGKSASSLNRRLPIFKFANAVNGLLLRCLHFIGSRRSKSRRRGE